MGNMDGRGDGPSLSATPDGGVIATGTTAVGFVHRFDAAGQSVWSRTSTTNSVMRGSVFVY